MRLPFEVKVGDTKRSMRLTPDQGVDRQTSERRIWEYMLGLCMEKRDFESASSLTWFGVADPFTERCDVEFFFVSVEW